MEQEQILLVLEQIEKELSDLKNTKLKVDYSKLNERIKSFEQKLDDLRHFRIKMDENHLASIENLSKRLENAPEIPEKISIHHKTEIAKNVHTWLGAGFVFMVVFGVGGFIYGNKQHNKKTAPEREEFNQALEKNETLWEQRAYLIDYVNSMAKKCPKSHNAFIEKNPVPEGL